MPSRNSAYSTKNRLKPALAVQVLAGERPDRPRERERQDRHRHRQPVEDEFHREVVVPRDRHPVAQVDRHVPRARRQHRAQHDDRRQQAGDRRRPGRSRVVASLARASGPAARRRRARPQQERARRRRRSPRQVKPLRRHGASRRPPRQTATHGRQGSISANSRWSRQPRYQSTDDAARGQRLGPRPVRPEAAVAEDAERRVSGWIRARMTQPLRHSRPMPAFAVHDPQHRLGASSR